MPKYTQIHDSEFIFWLLGREGKQHSRKNRVLFLPYTRTVVKMERNHNQKVPGVSGLESKPVR